MKRLKSNPILIVKIWLCELFDISASAKDVGELADKNNDIDLLIFLHFFEGKRYFRQHGGTEAVQIFGASERDVANIPLVVEVDFCEVGFVGGDSFLENI